jgi:hypothetical protein
MERFLEAEFDSHCKLWHLKVPILLYGEAMHLQYLPKKFTGKYTLYIYVHVHVHVHIRGTFTTLHQTFYMYMCI